MALQEFLDELPELLERAKRLVRSHPEGKPEENTKDQLIDPFLESLGYGPENRVLEGEIQSLRGTVTWVDYFLKVPRRTIPIAMVEAKPIWDEDIWEENKKQVLNYLRDYFRMVEGEQPVQWLIVTNFREFHVVRLGDREPFWSFTSEDLADPDVAATVYERLAREEFDRGRLFEFYTEKQRTRLGPQFLEDLKTWRVILANGIRQAQPQLPIDSVKRASQILLNRMLLVRILEAYGQESFYSLGKLHHGWETSFRNTPFARILASKFRDTWASYNTELFAASWADEIEIPNAFLEPLILPDAVPSAEISAITGRGLIGYRSIYNYDFTTISQDILGTAYEQFLAHELQDYGGALRIVENQETRKREGVYYTPEYVVHFIVAHTVGPRVQPIVDKAVELLEAHRFADARAEVEKVFSLRILDPACGSGSFLLGAFDYLDQECLRYNGAVERLRSELTGDSSGFGRLLEREVPTALEFHEERILVQLLYGVDLDTQAVGLAKLSLWTRLLRSRPGHYGRTGLLHSHLPALTVNVRNGNSLISAGAVKAVDSTLLKNAAGMARVAKDLNASEQDRVRAAARLDQLIAEESSEANESLIPDFSAAESIVQAAHHVGVGLESPDAVAQMRARLIGRKGGEFSDEQVELVREELGKSLEALEEVRTRRPLTWEMVFADVFDAALPEDARGFDVVIGNPPYYNIDSTFGKGAPELGWLKRRFPDVFTDKTDILFYFIRQGLALLKPGGDLSLIVSRAFIQGDKAAGLRRFLTTENTLVAVLDFLGGRVFRAGIATAIIQVRKGPSGPDHNIIALNSLDFPSVRSALIARRALTELPSTALIKVTVPQRDLGAEPWSFGPFRALFNRMDAVGSPLGDLPGVTLGQGMQTGANEIFVLPAATVEHTEIPPEYLRERASTGNTLRYGIIDNGERVLYIEEQEFEALPQPVQAWLQRQENTKLLRDRAAFKRGDCEWYQFSWPLNKAEHFLPKIVAPYRAGENRFAVDTTGKFIALTNTTVVLLGASKVSPFALAALLNSKPLNFRYRGLGGLGKLTGRGMFEYFDNQIGRLPIFSLTDNPDLERILDSLGREAQECLLTERQISYTTAEVAGKLLGESRSLWDYADPAGPYGDSVQMETSVGLREGHLLSLEISVEEKGFTLRGFVTEEEDWKEGDREEVELVSLRVTDVTLRRFLLAIALRTIRFDDGFAARQKLTKNATNLVRAALGVVPVPVFDRDPERNLTVIQRVMGRVGEAAGRIDIDDILLRQRAIEDEIDRIAFTVYDLGEDRAVVEAALKVVF